MALSNVPLTVSCNEYDFGRELITNERGEGYVFAADIAIQIMPEDHAPEKDYSKTVDFEVTAEIPGRKQVFHRKVLLRGCDRRPRGWDPNR